MKKYIVSIALLLIVQNICAMELDPFDKCIKYDEKCQLVAKYLHKYPKGKNEAEAKKIEWFLKDKISECVTVLPLLVTKYKNILETMEAQEYLDAIYEHLPVDVRKKIVTQALSYSAKEYYVTYNSLQFLAIYHPEGFSRYSSVAIRRFYKPYFLAEINEDNDVQINFSREAYSKDMPEDIIVALIASQNKCREVAYHGKIKYIRKLIAFLSARNERINDFKIMFNNCIEQLSQMNEKDGINRFIFLLERFKALTKHIIFLYTGRARLI